MPRVERAIRHDHPRPTQLRLRVAEPDLPAVLICGDVLSAIYSHANRGYPDEIGGYYVGLPLVDMETNLHATYIEKSVEAISTGTRSHVVMHPESFNAVIPLCERTGTIVVGYYHSHPGLSVFQSGTDTTYFRDYHHEPYQIAIVVDPTLTTKDQLDPSGKWIGFFAWDHQRRPTLLPSGNILVVSERPMLLDQHASVSQPKPELQEARTSHTPEHVDIGQPSEGLPISRSEATQLTQVIWYATQLLRGKLHSSIPGLPILLIPRALVDKLVSKTPDEKPPYSLLEGMRWTVGGYSFISVFGSTPTDPETLLMYGDHIEKTRRQAIMRHIIKWGALPKNLPKMQIPTSFQGLDVVGIAGDEDVLYQSRLLLSRKLLSTTPLFEQISHFARSCGDYCVLAVRESVDRTERSRVSFRALNNSDRRIVSLPASNVVIF